MNCAKDSISEEVQGILVESALLRVPAGKCGSQDDGAASERRRKLKEALMSGNVSVSGGQIVTPADAQPGSGAVNSAQSTPPIRVPEGKLALALDDSAASDRRRKLKEALMSGNVSVSGGQIVTPADAKPGSGVLNAQQSTPPIRVPEGKLAAFYWYEREPELLQDEKEAMARFFPKFTLEKLSDKRLAWVGSVPRPIASTQNDCWHLQLVYDHNHPHADTYGGSIKVYTIIPDLNELYRNFGSIPHVLRDGGDNLYICTARKQDVRADYNDGCDSGAIAVSRAVKWITVFELWVEGIVSDLEFREHTF